MLGGYAAIELHSRFLRIQHRVDAVRAPRPEGEGARHADGHASQWSSGMSAVAEMERVLLVSSEL